MDRDETAIARWLEPLARAGEWAEVFSERVRETALHWRDGELDEVRVRREEGTSARCRGSAGETLVFVPGADEAAAREAIRGLRDAARREPLPIRPARALEAAALEPEPAGDLERWRRRLTATLSRHAPRHRLRFRILETERRVVSPGRLPAVALRRLVSIEGSFVAASRLGDEQRHFSFHAPDSEGAPDELRAALTAAARARDRAVPAPEGEVDVVLAAGSAAVLLHEILSHPLEAGAASPLDALREARVAAPELEVLDDPKRLDLFGGYERDDEGTTPRTVRLIDAGRVAGRLTDRVHATDGRSTGHGRRSGAGDLPLPRASNLVVRGGQATSEELARRLANGIWIEEFRAASVELASGRFRLRFPHARRVRRGRFSDELGPGELSGEILPALSGIEPGLGREVRVCRALAGGSRWGQVIPVGGAAPDLLIRRLAARVVS